MTITIEVVPYPPTEPGRFWVLGPVEVSKDVFCWGVCDGLDLPGQRKARKPVGYREFWPTEELANQHCEELNRTHSR